VTHRAAWRGQASQGGRDLPARRRWTVPRAIVVILVIAGPGSALSGAHASRGNFQPTFETVECPTGMALDESSVFTCGYLTVLENRADPAGGTIRLFVLMAEPPDGEVPPDAIFIPGRDIVGMSPPFFGFGYRVGRLTIAMDPRGAGRSEPSLACPEVRRLTEPGVEIVLGSDEMKSALLDAVEACQARLMSRGVDLGAYNLAEMAADAEDLRIALGIDQWNLLTYGTSSAISFEILRRDPEHVRSATFDSPLPPTVDRFTGAIRGTEYAFDQVVAACSARPSCRRAYPHLRAAWAQGLRGLHAQPSTFADEDLQVVVDDSTAVRYLRNNMAQGINQTPDISEFPLALYELREHGWENGGPAGDEVGWAAYPPLHVGYEVQWGDASTLHFEAMSPNWPGRHTEGTFYSYMCHDEVPFVDEAALEEEAGGRSWYVEAYVDHPYTGICERWGVAPAVADPHLPVKSDVPILTMSGRFDPYSAYALVRRGTSGFDNGLNLRAPARSRNALSVECTGAIRDAFVTDPARSPDTSCLAQIHTGEPIRFILPPPPTRAPRPDETVITTVAGDGAYGSSGDGNLAIDAQLGFPSDVDVDAEGNLYVMEVDGERVRRVDAATGLISTAVGPPTGMAEPAPGQAAGVMLETPTGLAVDPEGNLYVGGGNGTHRMILRIDPSSGDVVHVAGTGKKGFSGDGGPATEAEMSWVRDIAVDGNGNVYFSDFENHRVRKVDTEGIIATVAGTGKKGFSGDGGPAIEARLNHPAGIFVDDRGVVYLSDQGNHRVRKIGRNGLIRTLAGNGEFGYSGDGGLARRARVGYPSGVTVDASGNVYIASQQCFCVRKVDREGFITTVVGRGIAGFSGDDGPALLATLSDDAPRVALGPSGELYIVDASNFRIRKVVLAA
jgi:pimeloyl-ACP methyl ester carboxylesterase/sugar lactone lactonase YvrE